MNQKECVSRVSKYLFAFSVKSRGCFVEQKDFWISNKGSCDRDSLLLSSTQLGSFVTSTCLITLGKIILQTILYDQSVFPNR